MTAKQPKAGDRIEWTHYLRDGSTVTRAGVIWDRAASPWAGAHVSPVFRKAYADEMPAGISSMYWVIPDERHADDEYSAICVAKSRRKGTRGELVSAHLGASNDFAITNAITAHAGLLAQSIRDSKGVAA